MSLRVLTIKTALTLAGLTMLLAGPGTLCAAAQADNTKANKDPGSTADQQKENKNDREITRQIRKAVVADKALSTYAHNIKIITTSGVVTLRGPVRTDDEKASIESKARGTAGVTEVKNELTIASKTS